MKENKTALLRKKICTAGYYHKRMKKMKRLQRFWARYVASPTKYSDNALVNMLRCERKAEWYRKRKCFEPIMPPPNTVFALELSEARFQMFARELRAIMGCDDSDENVKLGVAFSARLLYRVFNCIIPQEWTTE